MRAWLLLLAASCAQTPGFTAGTGEDGAGGGEADADTDADTDADVGTDEDGDGFTVEEGDCDDGDIGVNPARDEDPDDGRDNDCDGRVDEEWRGLVVARQSESGRSALVVYDTVGRVTDEVVLDEGVVPYDVEVGLDGGWVIVGYPEFFNISALLPGSAKEPATVYEVDEDGACTALASFSDETYWWGPPVRGVVPYGDRYLVVGPGALYGVGRDGSVETLASWNWDFGEPDTFELYAMDLMVDPATGEVGIVDLLGGFATWTPEGGFVIEKAADLGGDWKNWDWMVGIAGAHMDGGPWGAVLVDYATGEYALYEWDEAAGDWAAALEWADDLLLPLAVAEDGDHGEWYVTAKGGDHVTVWRLREEGSLVDDFANEVLEGTNYWGIASLY